VATSYTSNELFGVTVKNARALLHVANEELSLSVPVPVIERLADGLDERERDWGKAVSVREFVLVTVVPAVDDREVVRDEDTRAVVVANVGDSVGGAEADTLLLVWERLSGGDDVHD
jgi:hypothetical protein